MQAQVHRQVSDCTALRQGWKRALGWAWAVVTSCPVRGWLSRAPCAPPCAPQAQRMTGGDWAVITVGTLLPKREAQSNGAEEPFSGSLGFLNHKFRFKKSRPITYLGKLLLQKESNKAAQHLQPASCNLSTDDFVICMFLPAFFPIQKDTWSHEGDLWPILIPATENKCCFQVWAGAGLVSLSAVQLSIVFLSSFKDLTEAHLRCTCAFIFALCY